jgi:hypothetical protein
MIPEIPVDLRMRLLYPAPMGLLIPDIDLCILTEVFLVEIWQDLPEQVDIILTRVTEVMEPIGDPDHQRPRLVFPEPEKTCSHI